MNEVNFPPTGIVIALQFWEGDKQEAVRLAGLLADIEPVRRTDVTLAFCARHPLGGLPRIFEDPDVRAAVARAGEKFDVVEMSIVGPDGHPNGCNVLWTAAMQRLADLWQQGSLFSSAFFIEPDGVPLCHDWISQVKAEHEKSLAMGRRFTGPFTLQPLPHFNGSLVAQLSAWFDMPSLHVTPRDQAWDLFHAPALISAGRPTSVIKNVYGSADWTDAALASMARETAWLANTKDGTAIAWAEANLHA